MDKRVKIQKHETRVSRQTVCALKRLGARPRAGRSRSRSGSPDAARGRRAAAGGGACVPTLRHTGSLGPRGALARSAERRRSVRRAVSASYVRVCCLVSVYILRVRHVCACVSCFRGACGDRASARVFCVVNLHLRPCSVENDDSLQPASKGRHAHRLLPTAGQHSCFY